MGETTADVRRDIELTRERMSDTIAELERKLNVAETIREHPWPSLAVALGAGFLLASTRADTKAAAATASVAGGAGSKVGTLFDDAASRFVNGISGVVGERIDSWVDELKTAIMSPPSSERAPRGEARLASGARERSGPYAGDRVVERPVSRGDSVGRAAR